MKLFRSHNLFSLFQSLFPPPSLSPFILPSFSMRVIGLSPDRLSQECVCVCACMCVCYCHPNNSLLSPSPLLNVIEANALTHKSTTRHWRRKKGGKEGKKWTERDNQTDRKMMIFSLVQPADKRGMKSMRAGETERTVREIKRFLCRRSVSENRKASCRHTCWECEISCCLLQASTIDVPAHSSASGKEGTILAVCWRVRPSRW